MNEYSESQLGLAYKLSRHITDPKLAFSYFLNELEYFPVSH